MNDVEIHRSEEVQGHAQLLGELAREVQRDATKIRVAQEVVQVVGEKLKDQT